MSDYIELKPDDVIRDGDCWISIADPLHEMRSAIGLEGLRVGAIPVGNFYRPLSTLIRDVAIEILVHHLRHADACPLLLEKLRDAVGMSVEELRKRGK